MVSQESPPNPASSSTLHQFIISDSMAAQNHMENQHQLDAANYGPNSFRTNTNTFTHGLLPSMNSLEERMSRAMDLVQAPPTNSDHMSHTRHLMHQSQAQRLSLSLGSHMLFPPPSQPVHYVNDDYSFMGNTLASSSSASLNHQSLASVIGNSRYLKPLQSLLEEIVSVGGKSVDISTEKHFGKLYGGGRRGTFGLASEIKAELCFNGLLSADKHEFQAKIANLVTLLEEVEERCEKYYHQMEEVMSAFENVVGPGAAKAYTALALKAMSRHFNSLRDEIVSKINAEQRKMLQQDVPRVGSGLSKLSLFDREGRQKRMSLQQFGILHSQRQAAWRPIRGLPETSVAILRSWLFEHFLHPYPNDSEKLMLSSQTGLSKNQVSNWFINARVRLWKPMIEEMYKEEFADSSQDSNPLAGESNKDHTED